ncbi:MAG: glycosyltransferase family 2 protein [Bacteroidia bacterium]|nr:glycosyltransferase family 2 protein [Bacteroidia bacterium]
MYKGKKVIIVLPAYNAAATLAKTIKEIPDIVDELILCDDASGDDTVAIAQSLNIPHIIQHLNNKGYGANQKSLYNKALELGGDIIVMVHPDYQYTPLLIKPMVHIIAEGLYPVVLGSRILGVGALKGGMPLYKYIANRFLTLVQNLMVGYKLSEYHTGYRAFDRKVLDSISFDTNSDDFIFDNQMLSQIIYHGFDIGEITCPTKYFEEASSINFQRSAKYGLGVLWVSCKHFLQKTGLRKYNLYQKPQRKKSLVNQKMH